MAAFLFQDADFSRAGRPLSVTPGRARNPGPSQSLFYLVILIFRCITTLLRLSKELSVLVSLL